MTTTFSCISCGAAAAFRCTGCRQYFCKFNGCPVPDNCNHHPCVQIDRIVREDPPCEPGEPCGPKRLRWDPASGRDVRTPAEVVGERLYLHYELHRRAFSRDLLDFGEPSWTDLTPDQRAVWIMTAQSMVDEVAEQKEAWTQEYITAEARRIRAEIERGGQMNLRYETTPNLQDIHPLGRSSFRNGYWSDDWGHRNLGSDDPGREDT